MKSIVTWLQEGKVLLADGATGTQLQAMGLPAGAAPEPWNVENPAAIRAHHRAYLDAGSQIILTNSFGGNRLKLKTAGGLDARTSELNRAAAAVARAAADGTAFIAGDVGPTGELMQPYGLLSYEDAVEVFAEQARALTEGGADLIWVETMSDLNEAKAAVEGAMRAADLPVFCSLSFGASGRTIMGVDPAQAANELWPMGVAALGANCGEGLEVIPKVLAGMREAQPGVVLIAKPNAGLPHLQDGKTAFDLEPEAFAEHMPRFIELGAQVVGGCCGSTPAHIAAVAGALKAALGTHTG